MLQGMAQPGLRPTAPHVALRQQHRPVLCRAAPVVNTAPARPGQISITGDSYEDIIDCLAQTVWAEASAAAVQHSLTQPHPDGSTSSRRSRQHNDSESTSRDGATHLTAGQLTAVPRRLIALAGVPGSGKSTCSTAVAARLNELAREATGEDLQLAVVVPMDGFHLTRAQLDEMPNPKLAHARRGAAWTFDAAAFADCIAAIAADTQECITVPSFDHGVGDPVEGDIKVCAEHRIILVEGLYVLLEEPPWNRVSSHCHDSWFMDIPVDVAMERVWARQQLAALQHAEQARAAGKPVVPASRDRIDNNDYPNALLVDATKGRARVLVPAAVPFRTPR